METNTSIKTVLQLSDGRTVDKEIVNPNLDGNDSKSTLLEKETYEPMSKSDKSLAEKATKNSRTNVFQIMLIIHLFRKHFEFEYCYKN